MTRGHSQRLQVFLRRARLGVTNPALALRYLTGTLHQDRTDRLPEVPISDPLDAYGIYLSSARRTSLSGVKLFLSFDCDTDLDFKATLEVIRFLDSLGIKSTYAVPGVQLEKGAATYLKIAASGAEFMNHGYLPHTKWSEDRYVSTTWYHEMGENDVEADMIKGDDTIRAILGIAPSGFRAPHFGHYSEAHQLALIHGVARRLDYTYCSTTLPAYGLELGPLVEIDGLIEIPTFGSMTAPTCTLDSWTYLSDRRDYALGDEYAELMCETVDRMIESGGPALLSWYADPSHVAGQAPFERAMKHIAEHGIESVYGRDAAALAKRQAV